MLQDFFSYLATVLEAAQRAWRFDSGLVAWIGSQEQRFSIALGVAILAGASVLLGNSVTLFLNRVHGLRFWFSILLNGVALALLYALQAVVILIAGLVVLGAVPQHSGIMVMVMLATAPMIFGFLVLIPWAGPGIARVLQVWSFLVLWSVVTASYGRGRWIGLLITLIGWGAMQFLSWAFAKPVTWIGDRIWRLVTGKPSMLTGHDVLAGHPFMPVGVDSLPPRRGERR